MVVVTTIIQCFGGNLFPTIALVTMVCSNAQEASEELHPNRQTIQVLVRDSEEYPVENTEIQVGNLRSKVDGRPLAWDEAKFGPKPRVFTGTHGTAIIPIPKLDGQGTDIAGAELFITHADFVATWQIVGVGPGPSLVDLRPGVRIATNLLDAESGAKITQDVYGIASKGILIRDLMSADSGFLVSKPLWLEKSWLRFVRFAPGQPVLFSQLIWIDPSEGNRVLLRDIKMHKGTRVEGLLDITVPRPIRNGYVVAKIGRRAIEVASNGSLQNWEWYEHAKIMEDGSFVFESMPPDEVLQLIPICDDWVPQNPATKEVQESFPEFAGDLEGSSTYPQLVRVQGPVVRPVLKMRRAATVKVLVVDTQDRPLSNKEIQMSPNQEWFDGGGGKLGYGWCSIDRLKLEGFSRTSPPYFEHFVARTDDNGIAVIRGLPPNQEQVISVFLKGHNREVSGPLLQVRVDLKESVVTELTIKMLPEGTDFLKDEAFQGGKDD